MLVRLLCCVAAMHVLMAQRGHSPGKPGKVQEFKRGLKRGQGKARQNEKVGKTCSCICSIRE